MTDVSIVLPAYNDEVHVGDALRRLLAQRGVDLQIVVVDDGSTDGTAAAIAAVAADDARVHVLPKQPNGGVARARSRAVAAAAGEWVWFVDSDDDWPDDAAARLLATARGSGADVVVAAARFEFESGRAGRDLDPPITGVEPGAAALRRLLHGGLTGHLWNKLFRRSVLEQVEFVPARVQSDLPVVAGALAGARTVAYDPALVYTYRVRSGSIITSVARRDESLALIAGAVDRAVDRHPGLVGSVDHRYFIGRYVVLSGLKDALLGGYGPSRSARVRAARRRIGVGVLVPFVRRRDWRRLALAVTGRVSLPAYRRLLAVADR